jgi:phenylpyruvate tautomerase PptA (4-oxalocrotonate tautomerase family)
VLEAVQRSHFPASLGTRGRRQSGCLDEDIPATGPRAKGAIYDLSEGETASDFDKLKDLEAIVEISDPAERLQKLSEKHLQALKDRVTSLIVTPAHKEGRTVTTVVRDQMKQEGLITGQEHVVGRLQKFNLSKSQQRDSMNYEVASSYFTSDHVVGSGLANNGKFLDVIVTEP